jgi:hypothetical protein
MMIVDEAFNNLHHVHPYTPARSVILMIPGKTTCYDGWDIEYTGQLASGSYKHAAASQYICLDNKPEVLEHGSADDNGKLFYAAKTVCTITRRAH